MGTDQSVLIWFLLFVYYTCEWKVKFYNISLAHATATPECLTGD